MCATCDKNLDVDSSAMNCNGFSLWIYIDYLEMSEAEYSLLAKMTSFLYQQDVDPTRLRSDSTPHVLDFVITKPSDDIVYLKILPPLCKSDHIFMSLSMTVSAAVNSGSKFYYYQSMGCYDDIQHFIRSLSIVEELQSSNADVDVALEFI
ncbi:hypothetical protein QYM36_014443 [Artemia franciscana]|uniref:Uncharacterized protein n=1 Tax=Artemia franciscana TaxID=6661 RepID=A0AA88KY07_ARTSF|nr:hypothetical protein QYM36_014443 [Artemia franciscana]